MPTSMVHGSADIEASHSMTSFLSWLMSPQNYMPHGMCFLWQPELIALHVASDSLIALSYYSIPVALIYFVMKRTDLAFPAIFVLTGLFILACGTTHAMSVWTLWFPDYRVDGGIKAVTALLSIGTAIAIWKVMPLALALPSTAQLERANQLLGGEINQRSAPKPPCGMPMRSLSGGSPPAPRTFRTRSFGDGAPKQRSVRARSAGAACSRLPRSASPSSIGSITSRRQTRRSRK